jgi:transposase
MGSHTHSGQVQRLDVVETGRRRRWSESEKLRIVAESFNGPRLVSATARRYGILPSQLYTWRRVFRAERIGAEGSVPGFVPAMIIPDMPPGSGRGTTGRMEIVISKGRRIIVDAGVDAAALARVVAVLDR